MLITLYRVNEPPALVYLDSIDYFDGIAECKTENSWEDGLNHTRVYLKSGASILTMATIEELAAALPPSRDDK